MSILHIVLLTMNDSTIAKVVAEIVDVYSKYLLLTMTHFMIAL